MEDGFKGSKFKVNPCALFCCWSLHCLELLQVDELTYIYQNISFQCLLKTRSENMLASVCFRGISSLQGLQNACRPTTRLTTSIPPLFPALPHTHFPCTRAAAMMLPPSIASFMANSICNHSTFLAPTMRPATLTTEHYHILGRATHVMPEEFLHKWRRV
jgi:hypothetical protein